jgi:uncharacterized hydrophobic protein (TIGR00271 family)
MTTPAQSPRPAPSSLVPVGKLGFRGRKATPEERSSILDSLFFEGKRRVPFLQQFFVLMVLSATIAGFGLANNSAAVVIGAMLVAPLMTPILSIAAATAQGWGRRAADSLLIVLGGAAAAIAVGLAIGLLVPTLRTGLPLPSELLARTGPNLIDLGIALAAGAAGGFVAVRTEASGALPGVGIAVALVPPLATVGITAALGEWSLATGALLLFATNLVAIVLTASLVLVAAGFAADRDEGADRNARIVKWLVLAGVVVVTVPLAFHSWDRYEGSLAQAELVRDAREWATGLTVRDVEMDRSADPVQVTVTVTGSEDPPDPSGLAEMVADDLGRAVAVDLVYVPVTEGFAPER